MGIDKDLLLFLGSSGIGDGEPDLGDKLMKAFLSMLLESGQMPQKIVCMNSGIFLTTEGSNVIDELNEFAQAGTEILSCGTCLDYFGRKDKLLVGQPTNMRDTVEAFLNFRKILRP